MGIVEEGKEIKDWGVDWKSEWRQQRHEATIAEGIEGIKSMEGFLDPAWLAGLTRYLRDRIPTGRFLRAVLENDHAEAIGCAHPSVQMVHIKALQTLLHNYFPSTSYGSPEKVALWLERGSSETLHETFQETNADQITPEKA